MKLNIFNRWKAFDKPIYGRPFEYQVAKADGGRNLFVAYIKDQKTGNLVTRAYGSDGENALKATLRILKDSGGEAVYKAIEDKTPILAIPQKQPEKQIDWRDGVGHSYKAQRRLVGEQKEEKIRNFVAKHSRKVNKAGPMKDKKNDYTRKPKHKKREDE